MVLLDPFQGLLRARSQAHPETISSTTSHQKGFWRVRKDGVLQWSPIQGLTAFEETYTKAANNAADHPMTKMGRPGMVPPGNPLTSPSNFMGFGFLNLCRDVWDSNMKQHDFWTANTALCSRWNTRLLKFNNGGGGGKKYFKNCFNPISVEWKAAIVSIRT